MLQRLECQMGSPPGKGCYNIRVLLQHVKGGSLISSVEVGLENSTGVVTGRLSAQDRTSGFQQLFCGEFHISQGKKREI